MTIWKFPLKITDEQTIDTPATFAPMAVQFQGEQLCLWAMVQPKAPTRKVRVWVVGTGNPWPVDCVGDGHYLGTVQDHSIEGATFVWHVFTDAPGKPR